MKSFYRKSLEKTAWQITKAYRPDTLIKLILRTVIYNVRLTHAGVFCYDRQKDNYVLRVSRGDADFKAPSGFVKINKEDSLIKCFTDKKLDVSGQTIRLKTIESLIRAKKLKVSFRFKNFLKSLKDRFVVYQAQVCIGAFLGKDLAAVIFLGGKRNGRDFTDDEMSLFSVLASNVVMVLNNGWLVEDIDRQLQRNKNLFLQIVTALASSIEAKDKYTVGHTDRVMRYCLAMVRYLKRRCKNISKWEEFVESLRIAALLHDIGKIGISEEILNKPTALNDQELQLIQQHPITGENILKPIEDFKDVLLGVRHHHERYDGKGYPCGLRGRQIPLIAGIIAIADAFDAMVVSRPYRKAFPLEIAIKQIKMNRGKQFLPEGVDAFIKAYKDKNIQVVT